MTLWQSLPNILSLSRIFLAGIFILFLYLPFDGSNFLALLVFFLASLTDYFDGKIARKANAISALGSFLDPFADKILLMAAFISFVDMKIIAAWMVVVILAREFLITGLRLLVATDGKSIPATKIAKHKTVSQILAVYLILIFICIRDFTFFKAFAYYMNFLILLFMYITVFLTLVSGLFYLNTNKYVFRRKKAQ